MPVIKKKLGYSSTDMYLLSFSSFSFSNWCMKKSLSWKGIEITENAFLISNKTPTISVDFINEIKTYFNSFLFPTAVQSCVSVGVDTPFLQAKI